jgi:hypothetical protein
MNHYPLSRGHRLTRVSLRVLGEMEQQAQDRRRQACATDGARLAECRGACSAQDVEGVLDRAIDAFEECLRARRRVAGRRLGAERRELVRRE